MASPPGGLLLNVAVLLRRLLDYDLELEDRKLLLAGARKVDELRAEEAGRT